MGPNLHRSSDLPAFTTGVRLPEIQDKCGRWPRSNARTSVPEMGLDCPGLIFMESDTETEAEPLANENVVSNARTDLLHALNFKVV